MKGMGEGGEGGLKGMGRKRRLGEEGGGKGRESSGGRGVYLLPPSPGYATASLVTILFSRTAA